MNKNDNRPAANVGLRVRVTEQEHQGLKQEAVAGTESL
jgi:hypothetical protein